MRSQTFLYILLILSVLDSDLVSHPAVTAAIPGTIEARHIVDNQGAGRGRLPDAAMRREIERYWDAL